MTLETKLIPFDEFLAHVQTIFDEVETQGTSVTVEREGKLFTVKPQQRRRNGHKTRHFSPDDPLLTIVGIGQSTGPTDVSSKKHHYVAEAIAAHWEDSRLQQTGGAPRSTSESNTPDLAEER